MNFYLDFEATQFSQRIIAIGCVNDKGKEFYSLVRPPKGEKVNSFITNLTGITQTTIEKADTADVVFIALRDFIRRNSNNEETFFFVYGNCDSVFIDRTMNKMIDIEAKKFAYKLGASLIDFSTITSRFFRLNQIGLVRACEKFRGEEIIQEHNALEDAELLRELVYMINHCDDIPEENLNISLKKAKNQNQNLKNDSARPQILMYGHPQSDKQTTYKNIDSAIDTIYLKIKANTPNVARATIKKNIEKAIKNNTSYRGWLWKELTVEAAQASEFYFKANSVLLTYRQIINLYKNILPYATEEYLKSILDGLIKGRFPNGYTKFHNITFEIVKGEN